jgi:SPP1 gp7 family putative phage head morphogenesis protein
VAGENLAFRDIAVSHQIGVRRLSTGVVNDIIKLLNGTDADIVRQIEKLDPTSVASRFQRQRLDKLLKEIRGLNKDVYKQAQAQLKSNMAELAVYEAGFTARAAKSVLGADIFTLPTRQTLIAAVIDEPFQGRLLSEWVEGLEAGRFARLRDAIRIGVVEGEGINEIVKRVRGTPSLRFKDGVLDISRRSAEAMVRTAVNHTTTAARNVTMEENAAELDGWRFVATLETTTCAICANLDGNIYDIGAGPFPPRHINCRCTTAPVVKGGGGANRITFNKWLAEQSAEIQDEALGPTRGALYRQGKLPITKFSDDNRVFTLEELRARDPRAFKRAGL